jgi:hypothetical protein
VEVRLRWRSWRYSIRRVLNGDDDLSAFPHSAVFRPPAHLFSSHRLVYYNYFVLGYQSIGWSLVKRYRQLRPPVWCPQEIPICHPIGSLDTRSGKLDTLRLFAFRSTVSHRIRPQLAVDQKVLSGRHHSLVQTYARSASNPHPSVITRWQVSFRNVPVIVTCVV